MKQLLMKSLVCGLALFMGTAVTTPEPVAAQQCDCGLSQGCNCGSQRNCRCGRRGRRCQRCPQCNGEFCVLSCEEGKQEKTCYEIDYKTICIPKVVPPWRKCREPQCAEARSVKILTTKKYECPVCQYKWEVKKPEIVQPTPATTSQNYQGITPGINSLNTPSIPATRYGPNPAIYRPANVNNYVVPGPLNNVNRQPATAPTISFPPVQPTYPNHHIPGAPSGPQMYFQNTPGR